MERRDVVVVGGGLAGWTAAATAAGHGRRVHLVEGAGTGGRAATDEVEGFRLNRGAHAVYEAGEGLQVLARLGIRPTGGRPTLDGARARLGDRTGLLPASPLAIARTSLLSVRERGRLARLFATLGRWRPERLAASSTDDWFDDLGLEGDVRAVVAMFARTATYTTDHATLSADVAAHQLQLAVRGVRYLDDGWAQMVDGLRRVGRGRGVTTARAKALAVTPQPGGREVVVTTDDGDIEAAAVVLAAGTPEACRALVPEPPSAWGGLGAASFASCLDVGLDHQPALTTLLGVDRPLYAICHTPAARLAPAGSAVVHAMQYLRADERLDHAASRACLDEHLRLGGVDPDAAVVARYLHRMTTVSALPTPTTGGLAGRPGIDSSGSDRILVAGDWVGSRGFLADGSLLSGEAAGARATSLVEDRAAVH